MSNKSTHLKKMAAAPDQADPNVPKIKDLEVIGEIGRGAYGVIFKGKWKGAPCAIKEVHELLTQTSTTQRLATKITFERECEQSIRLRHPNIVQFFGIYRPPQEQGKEFFPRLVMELLHCSLHHILEPKDKSTPPAMPLQMKISLLCDVARGLRYLHGHSPEPIIHRDLSTNNVLVSSAMVAKIGDLGTMRFIDPQRQSQKMSSTPGTPVFMPPEALVEEPRYNKDIDVFSFACVALHTLSGEWPTPSQPTVTIPNSQHLEAVSEANRRKKYLDKTEVRVITVDDNNAKRDINVKELIIKCLENDRKKRPEIVEVSQDLEIFLGNIPQVVPSTKLHSWLTIQEHLDHIKALEDDVKFRDDQIAELQKMVNTKEAEIDHKNKEITDKDTLLQQQATEIEQRANEIRNLNTEMKGKNIEIERCGIQITEQQLTIQELKEKLPSKDLMQLNEKSTNYWRGLKVMWDKVADPPVKLISCCAVEMDGDVYVSGRSCYTQYINVLHYSQANKTWSILNHLPCTHSSLAVVRSKSQLIAVGGIYADFETEKDLEDGVPTKVSGKVLTWDAQMENWVNAYPDMPTARCSATAVGHGSTVIVAGGVTSPSISSTQVVEVMNVNDTTPSQSEWSIVQCLPHPSSFGIPLIINDQLYIASGYTGSKTTCGVLTAAIPALVTSKKDDTSCIWDRISDLPHDSLSISDYEGHLIMFGGKRKSGTQEDGSTVQYKVVSPIHLYNSETNTWDYVDHVPEEYRYWLGCGVHLDHNKIMLVGGAKDPDEISSDSYLSTCALVTINK